MKRLARVRARGASAPAAKRAFQRAFTLIELVIVITIAGVLAALAGPGFQDFIARQRIRTTAYDLIADLNFARSEAVKRNATVTISKSGTWNGGWTITDAGGTTLRTHAAFPGSVTIVTVGGIASVAFSLNGRASPAASFTIDNAAGKATIPAKYICVDQSGRPRSSDGSCT